MTQLTNLIRTSTDANVLISGITSDSRKVKPGFLFFAIRGNQVDGHDYIDTAIANGAAAIVCEKKPSHELSVPVIRTTTIRHDLAFAASRFFTQKPKTIAIVTGTNGKTSTADFTRQFWTLDNYDAASIGTLGFLKQGANIKLDADNTSPDAVILHELLTQVRDAAIIEGSSIGLEQRRLDCLNVRAAAFTNFTLDHLDYHKTMEEYFESKMILFKTVMHKGIAVLNSDIPQFNDIKKICSKVGHEIMTFGEDADLELIKSKPTHDGQILKLRILGDKAEYKVGLVGQFQAQNILCSLGLVIACGMSKQVATSFIEKLTSIPGRMEQAAEGIYVDYAHTPDALENALKSIRPHTKQKLFVVFGCGGDRDKTKRPIMGRIAEELADKVYITDDNPRTEDASQIRKEVMAGCPKAHEVADRETAIKHAMTDMKQGDILLIAGKGHEKYQIIGTEKTHFDDIEVVRKAMKEKVS